MAKQLMAKVPHMRRHLPQTGTFYESTSGIASNCDPLHYNRSIQRIALKTQRQHSRARRKLSNAPLTCPRHQLSRTRQTRRLRDRLADDPAVKNSKCLELTFKKGFGIYTFDISTTKWLQSKDLAHYDAIDVEVFNPANTPQPFYLSLHVGWGAWPTPPLHGIAEKFEVASGKWQRPFAIDLGSLPQRERRLSSQPLRDIFLSPSPMEVSKGDRTLYMRKISLVRLDLPAALDRLTGLLDKLKPLDHLPPRIAKLTLTLLDEKQSLLTKIADKTITGQDEQKLIDDAQKAYRLLLPVYDDKDLWLKHLNDGRQALAAVAPQVAKPEFGVGLASPLQKVFLDELPFPGTFGTSLSFSLARNECENAQVVVFAETRNLANVSIVPPAI